LNNISEKFKKVYAICKQYKLFSTYFLFDPENQMIVGGVNVKKGEVPWIVGFWKNVWNLDNYPTARPYCGGSIVSKR
jgi:hypothetical protein